MAPFVPSPPGPDGAGPLSRKAGAGERSDTYRISNKVFLNEYWHEWKHVLNI